MPRAVPWPLVAALALLLAACAGVPPAPLPIPTDAPFAIEGRLSAHRGNDAVAVTFAWSHAPPRDALVVSNPLGQTVAELTGDVSIPRVEMVAADGRRDAAADWPTLTERAIGFPLPVEGLAAWAQGAPRAGAPHTVEIDGAGRTGVLRQDGCEIDYSYRDEAARRPSLLRVTCHDLELRIVIDRWRETAT